MVYDAGILAHYAPGLAPVRRGWCLHIPQARHTVPEVYPAVDGKRGDYQGWGSMVVETPDPRHAHPNVRRPRNEPQMTPCDAKHRPCASAEEEFIPVDPSGSVPGTGRPTGCIGRAAAMPRPTSTTIPCSFPGCSPAATFSPRAKKTNIRGMHRYEQCRDRCMHEVKAASLPA
jgi:hypothetical protein